MAGYFRCGSCFSSQCANQKRDTVSTDTPLLILRGYEAVFGVFAALLPYAGVFRWLDRRCKLSATLRLQLNRFAPLGASLVRGTLDRNPRSFSFGFWDARAISGDL